MRTFSRELKQRQADPRGRRWVYVPYDQLTSDLGPLCRAAPSDVGIVLVEAPAKAARRPYHKQKLALVLTQQRHFALEQAARGVAVRYVVSPSGVAEALAAAARELGPMQMMEAAERELREELAPLVSTGAVEVLPHEGWLTLEEDFTHGAGGPPWRMERFYKHVRQRTGVLMQGGQPVGGKYSFDAENRKAWRGAPAAPVPPRFTPDAVTLEVAELVRTRFERHPGTLDPSSLPATKEDAEALWRWARTSCLPMFGPFEDAMSTRSTGLFHTRVAMLLNLHRLLPARLVREVAADDTLPLASREGFIRQLLGWREFVRHVHRATDGFRKGPGGSSDAAPSFLGANEPLPPAYWGTPSGLACLDRVVSDVWAEGWSHHITRLMVLSNLATLLGIRPRELTDWFWVAYVDAYDWVVEPNVLGMGTFGIGEVMTTKPYVSGAAYIHKMSDHCGGCTFDPKSNCPITRLYWAFLARHAERFGRNPRMAGPVASVRRRADTERAEDRRVLTVVRETLAAGERLTPTQLTKGT